MCHDTYMVRRTGVSRPLPSMASRGGIGFGAVQEEATKSASACWSASPIMRPFSLPCSIKRNVGVPVICRFFLNVSIKASSRSPTFSLGPNWVAIASMIFNCEGNSSLKGMHNIRTGFCVPTTSRLKLSGLSRYNEVFIVRTHIRVSRGAAGAKIKSQYQDPRGINNIGFLLCFMTLFYRTL